jgi:hypothetical protein
VGELKRGTDSLTADDADCADEMPLMAALSLSASSAPSAVSIQGFPSLMKGLL